MKKILLYGIAALMLFSCDNLRKKSVVVTEEDDTEETPTKKKKKKAGDTNEISDVTEDDEYIPKNKPTTTYTDNTTTTDDKSQDISRNTGAGWTSADDKDFLRDCIREAEKNVGEVKGKEYCECCLTKAKQMFDTYSEMSTMTETQKARITTACNEKIKE